MKNYIENFHDNLLSYEYIESDKFLIKVNNKFLNKLEEIKERGKTAKLWVQYVEMVAVAKSFIRSEKIGCLKDQIAILQQMMPYFFSAGHFNYTKSAYLYIQNTNEFISDAEVQKQR